MLIITAEEKVFRSYSTQAQLQIRLNNAATSVQKLVYCMKYASTLFHQMQLNKLFGEHDKSIDIHNLKIIFGMIKTLLKNGVDINQPHEGIPIITHALLFPALVKLLLNHGYNPNTTHDFLKSNALYVAFALYEHSYVQDPTLLSAELLAAAGIDLMHRDYDDETIFDYIERMPKASRKNKDRFKTVITHPRSFDAITPETIEETSATRLILTEADLKNIRSPDHKSYTRRSRQPYYRRSHTGHTSPMQNFNASRTRLHRDEIHSLLLAPERVKCLVAPSGSGKNTLLSVFENCVNAGQRSDSVKAYWCDETHPILTVEMSHLRIENRQLSSDGLFQNHFKMMHPDVPTPNNCRQKLIANFTETFNQLIDNAYEHYNKPVVVCLANLSSDFERPERAIKIEKLTEFCRSLQFNPRVKLIITTGRFDVSDKLFIKNSDVNVYHTGHNHPMRQLLGLTSDNINTLVTALNIDVNISDVLTWLEKTTLLLNHNNEPLFHLQNSIKSLSGLSESEDPSDYLKEEDSEVATDYRRRLAAVEKELREAIQRGEQPGNILAVLNTLMIQGIRIYPEHPTLTCRQLIKWRDAGLLKTEIVPNTNGGQLLTIANDTLKFYFANLVNAFMNQHEKILKIQGSLAVTLFNPPHKMGDQQKKRCLPAYRIK